jgi:hypothetical protein
MAGVPSLVTTGFAVIAVLVASTSGSASVLKPGVWVNGRALDLVTGEPPPSANGGAPLYIIAPIDVKHPQHPLADAAIHNFGIHDHVFAFRPQETSFSGVCDQKLVVAGPKAGVGTNVEARRTATPIGEEKLLYEVRINGRLLKLTWAGRIMRAQRLGLAWLIHTNLLACTITPRR